MKKLYLMLLALLVSACGSKTGAGEKDPWVEVWEVAMPKNGQVTDERHGDEQWFAYGALVNTTPLPANGVAKAHYFVDGNMIITLQFNVERAAEGYFYEGWAVNGQAWVSLGHVKTLFGDARHSGRFETDRNLRGHRDVKITLEADDGNPAPGEVVAEGKLKVTER